MAVVATPYSSVLTTMAEDGLNFVAGDAVVALCTSSYVPSQTGHAFLDDITNELTDSSYARQLLTGKSISYSSGVLTLAAADTTFPALIGSSIRYAIFAMDRGADSASPLLGYWDLGTNQNANVNDFKLNYHAAGFMTISLAS